MNSDNLYCGDCLEIMRRLPEHSVDLVFGSPPYEDRRTYGIDFNLKGQAWVDWMVEVYKESLRVCRGLVAFVVAGRTRKFSYSGTPLLLGADLLRAGITLREPLYFHRVGIPGSGGPDDMRHDIEYVIRATNGGRLPWSDNTAMGRPRKYGLGGPPSHRLPDGTRVNARDKLKLKESGLSVGGRCSRNTDGSRQYNIYIPPTKANPGNVIDCGAVGGGHLGSKLAHENEAPFPEALAEFMVRSFCPPGGIVLDPFIGSGTTAAAAKKNGRNWIGIDVRASQIELTTRRLAEICPPIPPL